MFPTTAARKTTGADKNENESRRPAEFETEAKHSDKLESQPPDEKDRKV